MKKTNPVGWFEIYVEDMERAKTFYETVLRIKMSALPLPKSEGEGIMWAFPWEDDTPNTSGALVKHKTGKPSTGGTLIYFSCHDCSVELSRVDAAGGIVKAQKFSIDDYGFCGIALDTEGNTIGFHSNR